MNIKEEFCENIRLYEKSMYHLAYSIVRNDADASEIISESIYRAYKNYGSLKNKKAFKTWILRIVHNTAVEMIRKNAKFITMDEIKEDIGGSIKHDITTKITVREAVESLKQPYRTVTVLFYYENLSLSQIAYITNTNIIAVKKQLSRARKKLLEILKEDFMYEKI